MTIKQLIIHAGYPKAGSTSLQESLYKNRELLAQKGFLYPSSWVPNHGLPLGTLFNKKASQMFDEKMVGFTSDRLRIQQARLAESLKAEVAATSCETLIISGENLCNFSSAMMASMLDFFKSLLNGPEVKIVLYVRNPVDYYVSALNILVWNMGRTFDALNVKSEISSPFEEDLIDGRPYSGQLPVFFEAAGREQVEICQFEAAIKEHGGPVGHFLSRLGLTSEEIKKFPVVRGNESKSQLFVDFIDHLNRVEPYYLEVAPTLTINPQRLKYDFSSLYHLAGPRFALTPSARAELADRFFQDAQWLKDQTSIDYLPELTREMAAASSPGPRPGAEEPSEAALIDLQKRFTNLNADSRRPLLAYLGQKAEDTGHPKYKSLLSRLTNADRIIKSAETGIPTFVRNQAVLAGYDYFDFDWCQIFVDYGRGFNERDSFTYDLADMRTVDVDLNFDPAAKVRSIRINPTRWPALVYFEELFVNGHSGSDGYQITADCLEKTGDCFIFTKDGPQIYLESKSPITSLRCKAVIDRMGSCFSSLNRIHMLALLNSHLAWSGNEASAVNRLVSERYPGYVDLQDVISMLEGKIDMLEGKVKRRDQKIVELKKIWPVRLMRSLARRLQK